MPERRAEARWEGTLKEGRGTMKLGSGAFEGKYSFGTRFEAVPGTNPEELIGAAHAGCYSMALSGGLTKAGHPPKTIETKANVHLDKVGEGFTITRIDLVTHADVPGISESDFQRVAEETKKGCPVSRALAAVDIRLTASLASPAQRR